MREGGSQSSQVPQPPQPPVFRGGTNLVQVDAIVSDQGGQPMADLTAADFELLDDGKPMAIDRVRFLGAEDYSGDTTLAPIRTHEDEEREASRDDVRLYAIVLDDYHVSRMEELRVIDPLVAFVRQLPPTDLVAVYYPLDSVTDVVFSRDREPVVRAIRAFTGRLGDYTPRHPIEEDHRRDHYLRIRDIELTRRQISASALNGLATHLAGITQGRKTIVLVSQGFDQPLDEVQEICEIANRANVAIYPLDPRGLTVRKDRPTTVAQIKERFVAGSDAMRSLALETGGRPIMQRNDLAAGLDQVRRDASAYYLITYQSLHPDDGRFHRITLRVSRRGATVFARNGYWAFKRDRQHSLPATALVAVPALVQAAIDGLADSLRPDADEPAGRGSLVMTRSVSSVPAALLAVPTVGVVRGRAVDHPRGRREFHRNDTVMVRVAAIGTPAVSGRLLDRRGQRLSDLPVASAGGEFELRLALGGFGPGDYVIELTARAGEAVSQQLVAFRVVP